MVRPPESSDLKLCDDGLWRPAYDNKLQRVDHLVSDLEVALPYCKQMRSVIQAGGAYGIWPLKLAKYFELVHSFEPDEINFRCLVKNCFPTVGKWSISKAALGLEDGTCSFARDVSEIDNAGAGYCKSGAGVAVVSIDGLPSINDIDLICLDVEGYELFALQGAEQTIAKWLPVIMIEAKELPQMKAYGVTKDSAVHWLCARGYRVVAEAHRDVILCAQ